jgi:hypothetical protein
MVEVASRPGASPDGERGRVAVVNETRPEEVGSADYSRTLDDAQLVALAQHVDRRTQAILAQGVPLPVSQIENHHLIGLLEAMVGKAKSLRVREWHLSWVDRMLDEVEATMRAQMLASGFLDQLGDSADLPGFP